MYCNYEAARREYDSAESAVEDWRTHADVRADPVVQAALLQIRVAECAILQRASEIEAGLPDED